MGQTARTVALGATLVLAAVGGAIAGEGGGLPDEGFAHTSLVEAADGAVSTHDSLADVYAWLAQRGAAGVDLDISGPVAVETTYILQPVAPGYRVGWHSNHGPVIVTVTTGTLTFVDDTCQTFDLIAGRSYVEPTGQVLDAVLLPE